MELDTLCHIQPYNQNSTIEILDIIGVYAGFYLILVPHITNIRTWLSLLNTIVLSAMSLKTMYYIIYYTNPTQVLLSEAQNTQLANYLIGFFASDMICAYIFEPTKINILSGYIHHSLYIGLIYYIKNVGHSNLIYLCLPFEIPTMLLDINRLDEKKRFDMSFGISFVGWRLIYNMYLIHLTSQMNVYYMCITSLMFPIHLYWFALWLKKTFASIRRYV